MNGLVPVRVTVADVWDAVPLDLEPSSSLADLKREALHPHACGTTPTSTS